MEEVIADPVGDMDQRKSLTDGPGINPTPCSVVNESAESTGPIDSSEKATALQILLNKDIHAADIRLSLFIAACHHYRWDSCVKPFPPEYIKDGVKDIESLLKVVESLPSLPVLLKYLQDEKIVVEKPEVVDLVYWVLIRSKDINISTCPKKNHETILNQVHSNSVTQRPTWIFQLTNKANEGVWSQLVKDTTKTTIFGYHGSRLENFHSIMHHGLQQHLNKNSLYGQGVYLSSELSVSLPYSPAGYSWGSSRLGGRLSCVALCEMLDHPDVLCQKKESTSRAISQDSVGGEVPETYFVVRNSDLMRVRYLLVYSNRPQPALLRPARWWLLDWINRNKLLTFIVAYVVLLASIGLSDKIHFRRMYKMFVKKWLR